ncbi:MAG: ThiF family adenylyltransferase [Chloroflexi bacterium]|nr:ThiF family adenylyltransferase [Chloroflexota bacterium]MCL5107494.1 ThiF family adenylyltransferase [Chloroflexota bacterium]
MDLQERLAELTSTHGELRLLSLADERRLAREFGIHPRQVELAALAQRVLPARYQRSLGTVGWEGQEKLLRASVAVVGAGGLGGYVIEGLARMGVGRLVVIDGDVFEEHNLNRQLLCTESVLGQAKAAAAAGRAAEVNAAVEVKVVDGLLSEENAPTLLAGADVAIDALDSLPARFVLERAVKGLGVPLVHGAIAGYIAQVMTIFPEDEGLARIYGRGNLPEKGVETIYGNPAATPMLCAACQVQEAIKVLLGAGEPLRNRLLIIDGEYGSAEVIKFGQ